MKRCEAKKGVVVAFRGIAKVALGAISDFTDTRRGQPLKVWLVFKRGRSTDGKKAVRLDNLVEFTAAEPLLAEDFGSSSGS